MAEYKTDAQNNYGWGLTLNMTGKAPAISKRIFASLADAQAYVDDAKDSAIAGLQLSVINDTDSSKNGIYFVKSIGDGETSGVLEKNCSVLKATTYTEATKLATEDRIGLVVSVSTDEESNKAGLYVVTAEGKIERLGTTASGDLDDRVKGLETTVAKLDGDEKTDGSVKKQISDAKTELETKIQAAEEAHTVVTDKNEGHVNVNTAKDGKTGKQTVTITEDDIASAKELAALTEKVGNEAVTGDTPSNATGLYAYVDKKVADKHIPSYTVSYDSTKGEYNLLMDSKAISGSAAISFKDYMVRSGSVVKGTWDAEKKNFTESDSGTSTAIKLVLNVREHGTDQDKDQVLYIDAETLVNVYTVNSSSKNYLSINGYEISLTSSAIEDIKKIDTIETDVTKLKGDVSGLTTDSLKEIEINGHKINSGNTSADVVTSEIKTGAGGIKDGETVLVESGKSIDDVVKSIYSRISELNGSKVASVTAVEKSGVNVDNTDKNNPKVSLNLEASTDDTVANGHIAIKVNEKGELYGEMYYLGDDMTETTK